MTFIAFLLVRGVGDQRQVAGALDRLLHHALVTSARAGNAPRQNLGALENVALQHLGVLVVDPIDLVDAELADLATAEEDLLLRLVGGGAPATRLHASS